MDADLRKRTAEGALFQSPAPVLLVPAGHTATLQPKAVLLAWNSRLEAGRALRAAMELLVQAEAVHVTIVDPDTSTGENGEEPGADVAAYLARQGVKVTVDILAGGGRDTADVLRQHASDIDADLIVMGAYGHSRMHERIFGGVTQSMLEDPKIPVFLAR
jgi:nucleotide-binding universal stress UspA family protein